MRYLGISRDSAKHECRLSLGKWPLVILGELVEGSGVSGGGSQAFLPVKKCLV